MTQGRALLLGMALLLGAKTLARLAAVPRSSLGRWIAGQSLPSQGARRALEDALGIPRWSWTVQARP